MKKTSGSGGCARPRETGISSSEDDAGGEMENEPGGLGSTNAGSTKNMGSIEDHSNPKSMADDVEKSSQDVGYGCVPSRQHLASDRIAASQQSKLNVVPAAGAEGTSSEETKNCSPEPPVTKTTLSELDIPRIVYNPKLRHDVNFDPDLHFRPNLDGESGRRKVQKANDFWNGLQRQIEEFMTDPIAFECKLAGKQWSLRSTLQAISEILGTLVPPEDRSAVEEILNVELLMQQFRKKVADLDKLGSWLARTLKSHCAPMRDEWVDGMVVQLIEGDRKRDVTSLVRGLRSLLGVLEAMKLDVANHQIRCLRPLLIQYTVEFEQTFFMKKIALGKFDIEGAQVWFQAAKSSCVNDQPQLALAQVDMWAFFKGFADLILPSETGIIIPDTFVFDEERMEKLRLDIFDAINLDICGCLLESTHSKDTSQQTRATSTCSVPTRSPLRPKFPTPIPGGYYSTLKSTNLPVASKYPKESRVGSFSKVMRRFHREASLDESLQTIELESEDDESDMESPASTQRTSFSSIIPSVLSQSVELPVATIDPQLSRAILAIVNESTGNNKWQRSCSDIALELLRQTPNHEDLSRLESQLTLHLCNPASSIFQQSQSHVLAELYPLLSEFAARYASLTATQLFEVATTPRSLAHQPQVSRHALGEIAKQMAHIGTLHWRVWAPLAYLVNTSDGGHVADATDRESRTAGKAWGQVTGNNRRPTPERRNSISESIPAGS